MQGNMTYAERQAELERRLKPSRYRHSLGVAGTAAELARRFGLDVEQARLAGLLHDCAREFPNERLQGEAERRGLAIGEVERSMPLLLHAPLGALLARERYGVEDEAVCRAIARHTVGAAGMTPLDKVVWYADMIEPGRDYPQVERLRQLAREATLDEMMLAGLSESIIFVVRKQHLIHPDTVLARNELLLAREA